MGEECLALIKSETGNQVVRDAIARCAYEKEYVHLAYRDTGDDKDCDFHLKVVKEPMCELWVIDIKNDGRVAKLKYDGTNTRISSILPKYVWLSIYDGNGKKLNREETKEYLNIYAYKIGKEIEWSNRGYNLTVGKLEKKKLRNSEEIVNGVEVKGERNSEEIVRSVEVKGESNEAEGDGNSVVKSDRDSGVIESGKVTDLSIEGNSCEYESKKVESTECIVENSEVKVESTEKKESKINPSREHIGNSDEYVSNDGGESEDSKSSDRGSSEKYNEDELMGMFNCRKKEVKAIKNTGSSVIEARLKNELEPLAVAAKANEGYNEAEEEEFRGCPLCNYTKKIVVYGVEVTCSCVVKHNAEKKIKEKDREDNKVKVKISDIDIMYSVIPESRRQDEFDNSRVRANIAEMLQSQGCGIVHWDNYIAAINNILASIATTGLSNSYILGAPNGFGKTTFVYTAIKRLIASNKKVVPYKTLSELAELKIKYSTELNERADEIKRESYKDNSLNKKDENDYSWLDYINSDVLFTSLSTEEFKEVESKTLYNILKYRGMKNKPTIVMTSQSLQWYTSDTKLYERYWGDMLAFRKNKELVEMDRLIHVSCYKKVNNREKLMRGDR